MNPQFSFLTAAILAAATLALSATPAFAQPATVTETTTIDKGAQPQKVITTIEFQPASSANDLNLQMLRDFESVKAQDPRVASAIAKDPALVQNPGFVSKHPALEVFLQRYPAARDEIVDSPGNFVTPVKGSTWNSHQVAGIPRD